MNDTSWIQLLNDPRNQFSNELLVVTVSDNRYVSIMKEITLSGKWKRAPLFFSTEDVEFFLKKN